LHFQKSILDNLQLTIYCPIMFDNLKNLANLPQMMAKAREMQEKMKALQDELARRTVSADAGAGVVTATVNGKLELISLRIDRARLGATGPEEKVAFGQDDIELLEDLIVAAVSQAQTKAAEMIREEMSKATGDLGLPPGMLGDG